MWSFPWQFWVCFWLECEVQKPESSRIIAEYKKSVCMAVWAELDLLNESIVRSELSSTSLRNGFTITLVGSKMLVTLFFALGEIQL